MHLVCRTTQRLPESFDVGTVVVQKLVSALNEQIKGALSGFADGLELRGEFLGFSTSAIKSPCSEWLWSPIMFG